MAWLPPFCVLAFTRQLVLKFWPSKFSSMLFSVDGSGPPSAEPGLMQAEDTAGLLGNLSGEIFLSLGPLAAFSLSLVTKVVEEGLRAMDVMEI